MPKLQCKFLHRNCFNSAGAYDAMPMSKWKARQARVLWPIRSPWTPYQGNGAESEIEDQAGYQPDHMNKNGVSYADICIYAYVWCMFDAVII